MNTVFLNDHQNLQQRLGEIADSLRVHPSGLGLLGLGSAGRESRRMDQYSDLDFFAIVRDGDKSQMIENLAWLADIHPISYCFRNTPDGYKLLFADGIFCEFAVFEVAELKHIPYSPGQFIWRDDAVPVELSVPQHPLPEVSTDTNFLLGELLTNLYVGLCRYHRGEKVSALRFIQVYAMDRLVNLLDLSLADSQHQMRDPFCIDRRAEQRHPQYQSLFARCLQGIDLLPQSAAAMLDFVDARYSLNPSMTEQIRQLI